MPRGLLVLTCLTALTAGCSSEARPYRDPFGRIMVDVARLTGRTYFPCARIVREHGFEVVRSLPSARCYRFDPPRRMRGVWLLEMEDSEFLPDADAAPAVWSPKDENGTYLEADWATIESRLPPPIEGKGAPAYAIEFIGRRATYPGVYGGMTGSRHMIILDKLLSARAVRPTPNPGKQKLDEVFRRMVDEDIRRRRAQAVRPRLVHGFRVPRCPIFFCSPGSEPDRLEDSASEAKSAPGEP